MYLSNSNSFRFIEEQLKKRPIITSLALVVLLLVFYLLLVIIIQMYGSRGADIARGTVRFIVSVPAIFFLGVLVRQNGFKFAFSLKGSVKALLFCAPLIVASLSMLLQLFGTTNISENFTGFSAIIYFQLSTGVFEETLMRGLFMTALLCRFGGTKKGRLLIILANGMVFGLMHPESLYLIVGAGLIGMFLAAVFAYSGNLIVLMLFHSFWNIMSSAMYASGIDPQTFWHPFFFASQDFMILHLATIVFVVLTIIFVVFKAAPFSKRFPGVINLN